MRLSAAASALSALLALSASASAFQPHSVYEDFFARPQYQVLFTKHLVRESDLAPAGDLVVLPGPAGGRWACRIPEPEAEAEEDAAGARDPEEERREAEAKLSGLSGGCLYYVQGWFTYEYCHLGHVRQFHKRNGPDDTSIESQYMLGRTHSGIEVRAGLDGKKYARARFEGGTVCDLTGQPRAIEVQFHCPPPSVAALDHISLLQETSTCNYLLLVQTPRLCGGAFSPAKHGRVNNIRCGSVVSDGYYELAKAGGELKEVDSDGVSAAQAERAEARENEPEDAPRRVVDPREPEIKIMLDLESGPVGSQAEQAAAQKVLAGMLASVATELKRKLQEAQERAEEARRERRRGAEEVRRNREGLEKGGRVLVDAQGRARVVDDPPPKPDAPAQSDEEVAGSVQPSWAEVEDEIDGVVVRKLVLRSVQGRQGEDLGRFEVPVENDVEISPELVRRVKEGLSRMLAEDHAEAAGAHAPPAAPAPAGEPAAQAPQEPELEAATPWMKDAEKEMREEEEKEKPGFTVADGGEDDEGDGIVLEL
ncbi:hypothetical protein DFJ74DRAFT_665804 [Hyaloraphidium curvatum]|nr:hypothetical protein DFJ74DRAFT_665804 [Hyaloraphidium curvatum]